jgi:polyisoprenoid-binding protein YceI
MKFIAATLLLFVALAAPPAAHAADWSVDAAQSSLRFAGVSQGESFEGSFARFTPAIRFDPAALPGSRFDVTIDLASADTRNEERDSTLVTSDFFDVEKFPQATFVAEDFVAGADGGFEARGTLSLRGVSKPVTLSFTWTPIEGGARLDGSATLDRIAFGVGAGDDWSDPDSIAHQVDVLTTLVLRAP